MLVIFLLFQIIQVLPIKAYGSHEREACKLKRHLKKYDDK